jgi:putative ABC transport system permease protein
MGLQLVKGRFYSDDLPTDKGAILVNETFLRDNKVEDPIGVKIPGRNGTEGEVVGVVKDFYFKSVSNPLAALVIRNDPRSSYCLVKLQTPDFNSLKNFVAQIKSIVSELSPAFPVEISFLDRAIENMYQSELLFHRIFSLFAMGAIFICCLGNLAMSLFACQRRTKEIGIRKVNGAKTGEILMLLNRDFIKWVAVAFLIASPVAWYVMKKWLENYAYKTEVSWWIFALAGILALGIVLVTVSWQSWKAATKNPVEALRYE